MSQSKNLGVFWLVVLVVASVVVLGAVVGPADATNANVRGGRCELLPGNCSSSSLNLCNGTCLGTPPKCCQCAGGSAAVGRCSSITTLKCPNGGPDCQCFNDSNKECNCTVSDFCAK